MNCASRPDGGAVPGDVPGETLAAPSGYQDRYRWLAGLREDPEGLASVPAPDSYPHVTCGCPVTGRRPHGVVAAVARRHRKRGMAWTTTQAPRRRPARPPVELARGRQASGRDARRYCPEFPMMGSPRVASTPIPFRPWHRIRAGLRIAESRPPGRLWVREPAPGGLDPGRQGAVPGTRSRPRRPW